VPNATPPVDANASTWTVQYGSDVRLDDPHPAQSAGSRSASYTYALWNDNTTWASSSSESASNGNSSRSRSPALPQVWPVVVNAASSQRDSATGSSSHPVPATNGVRSCAAASTMNVQANMSLPKRSIRRAPRAAVARAFHPHPTTDRRTDAEGQDEGSRRGHPVGEGALRWGAA
jgi:hypothetical protein